MAVCDSALGQVVWRQFYIDLIAHQDTDPISAHTPGDRSEYHVLSIVELDLKKCVGLLVYDDTSHFYKFFFHSISLTEL